MLWRLPPFKLLTFILTFRFKQTASLLEDLDVKSDAEEEEAQTRLKKVNLNLVNILTYFFLVELNITYAHYSKL